MDAICKYERMARMPITVRDLMDSLGWDKGKVHKWARPLNEYDWIQENGRGKEFYFKVGIDPRNSVRRLPDIEGLAELFPELAKQFAIIHPLTGRPLNLANGELDPHAADGPVITV